MIRAPMDSFERPLLRAVCALALVLGLGLSSLEEMGCSSSEQGRALQSTSVLADRSTSSFGVHSISPLEGPHCCPCIHTYPVGFVVHLAPVLAEDMHRLPFAMASRYPPTPHSEPLLPPPIA
jgi:hypothetical protein